MKRIAAAALAALCAVSASCYRLPALVPVNVNPVGRTAAFDDKVINALVSVDGETGVHFDLIPWGSPNAIHMHQGFPANDNLRCGKDLCRVLVDHSALSDGSFWRCDIWAREWATVADVKWGLNTCLSYWSVS